MKSRTKMTPDPKRREVGLKPQAFVANPGPLLDLVEGLFKIHANACRTGWNAEVVAQHAELSRTVERMTSSKIPIPEQISQLYQQLSDQVGSKKHAVDCLNLMEERLSSILQEISTVVRRLTSTVKRRAGARRITRKRTSQTLWRKEVVRALKMLGGSAPKAKVLQMIKRNMASRFKPLDLEKDSNGIINWQKWVSMERNAMVNAGLLKAGTTHGVWELARSARKNKPEKVSTPRKVAPTPPRLGDGSSSANRVLSPQVPFDNHARPFKGDPDA